MVRKAWIEEKENMKYTVFRIDNSRDRFSIPLERYLTTKMSWQYRSTEKVNGSHKESLHKNIDRHGYEINWKKETGPLVGQLGIWYTVLNSFELAPHVTFEDDAILDTNFGLNWNIRFRQLPKDTDFFSLFIPRDSDHLWDESLSVSRHITRTYQRYGGVSMYYTKQGVEKIKELLSRDGITGQYDDTLYAYSKSGELNGYCSKPSLPDLVYITGEEDSIVQETMAYAR
jgi:hypothetical protein